MEANKNQTASQPAQTPPANSTSAKSNMYPVFNVPNNANPNRFLAFPIIGYLVKIILAIPIMILLFILGFGWLLVMLITPFIILFTGKYWDTAYSCTMAYIRVFNKTFLYLFGITDKYPGFGFTENGIYALKHDKPAAPSRLLGFPVLGFFIRIILLIPYVIYESVLSRGAGAALVFSWFAVLFTGNYPESLYEYMRDYLRVGNAGIIYLSYLSDTYPSFYISLNHKTVKIILIVLGAIFFILSLIPSPHPSQPAKSQYYYPSQTVNHTP